MPGPPGPPGATGTGTGLDPVSTAWWSLKVQLPNRATYLPPHGLTYLWSEFDVLENFTYYSDTRLDVNYTMTIPSAFLVNISYFNISDPIARNATVDVRHLFPMFVPYYIDAPVTLNGMMASGTIEGSGTCSFGLYSTNSVTRLPVTRLGLSSPVFANQSECNVNKTNRLLNSSVCRVNFTLTSPVTLSRGFYMGAVSCEANTTLRCFSLGPSSTRSIYSNAAVCYRYSVQDSSLLAFELLYRLWGQPITLSYLHRSATLPATWSYSFSVDSSQHRFFSGNILHINRDLTFISGTQLFDGLYEASLANAARRSQNFIPDLVQFVPGWFLW